MSKQRPQKKGVKSKLGIGICVRTVNNNYAVRELLGSGGFGEVYRVTRENDGKREGGLEFAMKTEFIDKKRNLDRLKVEMVVFEEIGRVTDPSRRQHFIGLDDKGRTSAFRFIIMTLVSYSVESIRKDMLKGNFSKTSALVISKQTLQALTDLHSVGYIHRDIKPHNFAVGRGEDSKIIYILDFGIARKFLNKDGKIRVPRQHVRFLGTVKYASRNCHTGREQSRADDLETWLYMVIDLFNNHNLPWYTVRERPAVLNLKDKFFELTDTSSFKDVPSDYYRLLKYIRGLCYSDDPDYPYMQMVIEQAAERSQCDLTDPLDWEGKTIKKIRKKKAANQELEDDENDDSEKKRKREARRRKLERAANENKNKNEDDEDDSSTDPYTIDKQTMSSKKVVKSVYGRTRRELKKPRKPIEKNVQVAPSDNKE